MMFQAQPLQEEEEEDEEDDESEKEGDDLDEETKNKRYVSLFHQQREVRAHPVAQEDSRPSGCCVALLMCTVFTFRSSIHSNWDTVRKAITEVDT